MSFAVLALYGSAAYLLVVVKCMLKISFKSFVPKQKLALFLPSCRMDQVKVCLHFLFWFSKIFWIESNRLFQVRKYLHISAMYIVQCMYILWKTYFLHFARLVGTFLVCRRKLVELSSKVQIVWKGLKIWKKIYHVFLKWLIK